MFLPFWSSELSFSYILFRELPLAALLATHYLSFHHLSVPWFPFLLMDVPPDTKSPVGSSFLSVLKNVRPIPSTPHSFRWLLSFERMFPCKQCVISDSFQDLFFSVRKFNYDMSKCAFLCIYLIWGLLSFLGWCFRPNLGCFQTWCFPTLFSPTFILLSPWALTMWLSAPVPAYRSLWLSAPPHCPTPFYTLTDSVLPPLLPPSPSSELFVLVIISPFFNFHFGPLLLFQLTC